MRAALQMQPGRSRPPRVTPYNAGAHRVPETDPHYLSGGSAALGEGYMRALRIHSHLPDSHTPGTR
jgi:hypothetical protein